MQVVTGKSERAGSDTMITSGIYDYPHDIVVVLLDLDDCLHGTRRRKFPRRYFLRNCRGCIPLASRMPTSGYQAFKSPFVKRSRDSGWQAVKGVALRNRVLGDSKVCEEWTNGLGTINEKHHRGWYSSFSSPQPYQRELTEKMKAEYRYTTLRRRAHPRIGRSVC